MNKTRAFIFGILALLFVAVPALAQQDGWDSKSRYNHYYDADNMVYLTGEITNIDRNHKPLADMAPGFAVTVKTDDGKEHLVEIGPVWFTQFYKAKWDVAVGDRVDVRGSEVTINGKTRVMAVWGRKGDNEMTIRAHNGSPVWDLQVEPF